MFYDPARVRHPRTSLVFHTTFTPSTLWCYECRDSTEHRWKSIKMNNSELIFSRLRYSIYSSSSSISFQHPRSILTHSRFQARRANISVLDSKPQLCRRESRENWNKSRALRTLTVKLTVVNFSAKWKMSKRFIDDVFTFFQLSLRLAGDILS